MIRNNFIFLLMVLAGMTACQTEAYPEVDSNAISGEYSGIFERDGEAAAVQLRFEYGRFVGQSEITKFPAICEGIYSVNGDHVLFKNSCMWTAEFDWTLILEGNWKFREAGENLFLTKSDGDKHTLTRN